MAIVLQTTVLHHFFNENDWILVKILLQFLPLKNSLNFHLSRDCLQVTQNLGQLKNPSTYMLTTQSHSSSIMHDSFPTDGHIATRRKLAGSRKGRYFKLFAVFLFFFMVGKSPRTYSFI